MAELRNLGTLHSRQPFPHGSVFFEVLFPECQLYVPMMNLSDNQDVYPTFLARKYPYMCQAWTLPRGSSLLINIVASIEISG